jgi:hypothetical protein
MPKGIRLGRRRGSSRRPGPCRPLKSGGEEIGTYNILRRPLDARTAQAADGRRQRRQTDRGVFKRLKSLRSQTKNRAFGASGCARLQQTCSRHARPAAGDPDAFRYHFEIIQDPQETNKSSLGAPQLRSAAWPLNPNNRIVHFANDPYICNKTLGALNINPLARILVPSQITWLP